MPLTPTMRPDNGCPLDLSYSMLRSVSPVHLAYLANMGVRASMSISLIVGGRLWGLISSGHRAPLRLPYRLHSTCETIGRLVSLQIGALQAPCVLWFRPELIHSVTWAGNPQLPSGDEAMLGLNPNRSFEMWKALVHDQSAAWARAELDAAADLRRSAIEIDLARQVAKEKAAVQARDELVAVVSHDLRTPLSVVVMQSVILQRLIALEPVESSQRIKTSAQIIQRSAERMNAMLQDLLDLAKIEAGRFEIRRSDQSAALILEEAFELLQSLAAAKRIKLVAAQTAVDTIRVDPERVFQVLSNLIGNAIKFSPEGGQVSLGAGRVGQMCEFRIADEGIGIAPDQLSRIFDRYWQAKQSDAMGAGLGLYIARGIVEAHGGTIRAESVLDAAPPFSLPFRLREAGGGTVAAVSPGGHQTIAPPMRSINENGHGELRRRLREATGDAHRRLDLTLDLLQPQPERTQFINLLKQFHGFHRSWELALLARLPADAAWLATRSRVPHLEADMRSLGVTDKEVAQLPTCPEADALCRDQGAALGSLYVVEGSTLGGKVISRHLSDVAWYPSAGLTYLDPYGLDTALRWKEIVARLDQVPRVQWAAAERGALATFSVLEAWLSAA